MIRKLQLLLIAVGFGLLAFLLAGCGGGGGSSALPVPVPVPVPVPDVPPVVETVLFRQVGTPILVNSPGGAWAFPRDVGYVATFDLGAQTFTWDGRSVGIVNDSWASPAGSSNVKTVNYSWMPSNPVRPWADGSNASVCTSFAASVPESTMRGMGNYAGADIWLHDSSTGKVTSGKTIIVSAFFFVDGKGDGPFANYGPHDYLNPLNAVQFGGPLAFSPWLTTTSGWLRTSTWSEPERFGFCISRDQALYMLVASVGMLGGMADIHDMSVEQALLSNETALPGPSSQDRTQPGATLTTYFSNWTVTVHSATAAQ